MVKETITYKDYDGNERTEDFYFHYSKAEIAMMELTYDGGLSTYLKKIVDEKDPKKIIEIFKKIILEAYGVKSADGKRFIKNEEVRAEFEQSPAYSDIFMSVALDSEKATSFINGIIPNITK